MSNIDKNMLDDMEAALEKAKNELSYAIHFEECGINAGIRKMNANKASWLKWVVYLAERGLEVKKEEGEAFSKFDSEDDVPACTDCSVALEPRRLIAIENATIEDLSAANEELAKQLKSLRLSYDCEVAYRKALAHQAKLDWCADIIKRAHDRCWLDGTVLVTPVEYLDRCLLEMFKE